MDWGTELRQEFRELQCMVHEHLVDPAPSASERAELTRRFVALHQRLATYPYSRGTAEAWLAFYRITARMFERLNRYASRARIPVLAHNGHQHAARMWIHAAVKRKKRLPLVHFDTHADMRAVLKPRAVVQAVSWLRGGPRERERGHKALARLLYDHATPVTGGILADAVGEVVWAHPKWNGAPHMVRRPVLWASVPTTPAGHRVFQMLHDRAADPDGALPAYSARAWDEVDGFPSAARRAMEVVRERRLSYLQTFPGGRERLAQLLKAVPAGEFVLDLDLDYFMSIDSESGFSRRGRDSLARGAWDREYGKRLRAGRRLLDQRLAAFRTVLVTLRDRNRVPALVTLADSTYMPFFPTLAGQAYWEYLPREYAGYLHWRVRHLLEEVYGRYGIAAGV